MKAEDINTLEDAERFVEGVINDFESGVCDKTETMKQFAWYTGRLNLLFWQNAKKMIKADPKLLEE